MKNTIAAFLIILTGCMDNNVQSQPFSGNFAGQQPGINSAASIKENGNVITGSFELNGRPGNINATVNGGHCQGTLFDIQMQKNYAFTGYVRNDSLFMDIVFPELNNQVISLQMKRIAGMTGPADPGGNGAGGERAAALVGLWRYTETFSSGSGDNYASFSTDYFMEFKADGTVYSWTGKSAGGSGNVTLEGYPSGTQKGRWSTEGKTLYLTDIAGGQKNAVLFYAEANRMMLHNGGSEKKIMTRIR
jgi:hypothetical protein